MRLTHLIVGTLAVLFAAPPGGAAQAPFPDAGGGQIAAAAASPAFQGQGPAPRPRQQGPLSPPPVAPPPGSVEVTEPFSQTLPLAPGGTVDLIGYIGNITITGGTGDEVRVDAVKRAWGSTEAAARNILREMAIRITDRGGTIEIRPEGPRRPNWVGSVEYTVAVPSRANVTVRTGSGNVRITNIAGALRAESLSGRIDVSAVSRVDLLKSFGGDIEMRDIEGEMLTAETTGGALAGRNLKVRSIDVRSVSGALNLSGVESVRARIATTSGSIDYEGRMARSGSYEIGSQSGDIRVVPLGAVGFDLEASSIRGRVRSELTLTLTQGGGGNNGRGRGRLRGTFGDAGAALSIRSFSGNIVIAQP